MADDAKLAEIDILLSRLKAIRAQLEQDISAEVSQLSTTELEIASLRADIGLKSLEVQRKEEEIRQQKINFEERQKAMAALDASSGQLLSTLRAEAASLRLRSAAIDQKTKEDAKNSRTHF